MQNVSFSVDNVTEVTSGGHPCLRFDLHVCVDGVSIMTIRGWRLGYGKLFPPAARGSKGGYYLTVVIDHPKLEEHIVGRLMPFKVNHPAVVFPGNVGPAGLG